MEANNRVGTTVAGCRLLEAVGRGTMGEVYRGLHEGLQRAVAVKILEVGTRDSASVDRLLVEARALAKIEHPNIVRVYDVGVQSGAFYIVMQYLAGTTLKARFEESGAFPLEDFYRVGADVARGLGAMHDAGLIHRDLKLENVILDDDGRARITDFGLVQDPDAKDEYQGCLIGTPPYIPPEIWLGRPADKRSDLYSLGVLLYTLACGDYPFRGKTLNDYRDLHLTAVPGRPSTVNTLVSEELASVLLKLLGRRRDQRYPSVQEFLADFERCRAGKSPEALTATGRRVKCGFCEAVNPAASVKCSVCGEPLSGGAPKGGLDFQLRFDEIACPSCGATCERNVRACSRCGKGICLKCRKAAAVKQGCCARCAPPAR